MIKILSLLVLVVFCSVTNGHEIIFGGWSKHLIKTKNELNENNYGLGYSHKNYAVGVYKNSFKETSYYAYKSKVYKQRNRLKLSVKYGIVSGYNESVIPFALPVVSYEKGRLALDAGALKTVTFNFRYKYQ